MKLNPRMSRHSSFRCVSPAIDRSAAERASLGLMRRRRSHRSAAPVILQFFVEFPLHYGARKERPQAKPDYAGQAHMRPFNCTDNRRDGYRQALPLGASCSRILLRPWSAVILGAPVVFTYGPFGADPAVLFELVQAGIQRSWPTGELRRTSGGCVARWPIRAWARARSPSIPAGPMCLHQSVGLLSGSPLSN